MGSVFKEDALFIRFKAAYELGMKSILTKKEQRLLKAKLAYAKLIRSFPETKNLEEANKMLNQIEEEILKVKEQFTIITQNK